MIEEVIELISKYRCDCGSSNIIKLCIYKSCNQPLFCEICESKESNHQEHKKQTFPIRHLFDFLVHNNDINFIVNNMIDRINSFVKTFNRQMDKLLLDLINKKQIINVAKLRNQQVLQEAFKEINDKIEIIEGKLCLKTEILQSFHDLEQNFSNKIEKLQLDIQDLSMSSIEEQNNQYIGKSQVQSEIINEDKQSLNQDSMITIFSKVKCLIHENYMIDRICLDKSCERQKNLCINCEIDHGHKGYIRPFEEFRYIQTFNDSPLITQQLSNKLEQFLNEQQQEFINELKMIQPNKLMLNYIIQSEAMPIQQIQQRFDRLCQQISIDDQNKLLFNIDKISDLFDIIQGEIDNYIIRLRNKMKNNYFPQEIVEQQNIMQNQQLSIIEEQFQQILEQQKQSYIPEIQNIVQNQQLSIIQDQGGQNREQFQQILQSQYQQSQLPEIINLDQNQNENTHSSFTKEYTSKHIECISQKIIKKKQYYTDNDVACLNIPLNNLDYKSYVFRVNNSKGVIWIGLAKLEQLKMKKFILEQKFAVEQNHGFYMVASNGYCYHSDNQEFNHKKRSIYLEENTEFIFTFDTGQIGKEFNISHYNLPGNSFQMPLPSFTDEQMSVVACIILENQDSEVQLISEY